MKKLLILFVLLPVLFTGCAKKVPDLDNIKESYSSVISMPYAQLIGKNLKDVSDKTGKLTFDEASGRYYSDKKLMEFAPYFTANEDGFIKICGFETVKESNEAVVSYIRGLYNILCATYGSVEIDPTITKRVNSIEDFSKCKDGEEYKEMWACEGYPVEYFVSFNDGKAKINIQYNKTGK